MKVCEIKKGVAASEVRRQLLQPRDPLYCRGSGPTLPRAYRRVGMLGRVLWLALNSSNYHSNCIHKYHGSF